jgi:predicted Co/Zn/Cd cation transporter (cation efflux family)
MSEDTTELRALAVNKWANLGMAVAGVVAAITSRSDALMVDGLYSAVNFVSAIIAMRISQRIGLPPDRGRPWGYGFEESLYVTFRSLVLVGILAFAAFAGAGKIFTFLTGGDVPELVFGPIVIYSISMVVICLSLAFYHHRAFVKTGKTSSILKTESRAALIDGAISLGSGAALISLPFLADTVLAPIIPIGDAIIVLIMVAIIIWQPLGIFRSALAELAGVSAPSKTHLTVSRAAKELASQYQFRFLRAAVQRAGRSHFIVVYVDPVDPVSAKKIDEFWRVLNANMEDKVGSARCEVVVTEIAEVDAV